MPHPGGAIDIKTTPVGDFLMSLLHGVLAGNYFIFEANVESMTFFSDCKTLVSINMIASKVNVLCDIMFAS